jgi:hypothetical protein
MSTANAAKKLPLTHYDHIKKLRPEMWDYLDQELEHLQQIGWQGSVSTVDDIDSQSYTPCLKFLTDKFYRDIADSTGFPVEMVAAEMKGSQDMALLLHTLNHDYHNILNFELAGKKTFHFNDNLTDHLLATELNIDAELVRPPFDTSLFLFSAPSAIEAAYAFLGHQARPEDFRHPLSVFVTSLPDKNNPEWRKILMCGSHWRGNQMVFLIKREVAIRPGWKLEDALRTDWEKLGDAAGEGVYLSADGTTRPTDDAEFYTDGLALFRLILNAALYLGSSDPDIIERCSGRPAALRRAKSIKSATQAKKARQEAKKESELDYASVGESVTPIYVRKGGASTQGPEGVGGFREYASRFIVRGHWRNQPHGPGLSERKLIWIKPYYKGPEMAELVNRPYVVS